MELRKTISMDDEQIDIFIDQDVIEVDYWCGYDDGSSRMRITPAVARELGAYLLKIADEIEGK